MNPYLIPAHNALVQVEAMKLAARGGWRFELFDSDAPRTDQNRPPAPYVDMDNPFGFPVHVVTFFDQDGKFESVIAGLLLSFPQITWDALTSNWGAKLKVRPVEAVK